jgi:dihydrofolate reductase
MRKIIYSVAMSLDGYVAGSDGEADWIIVDPEIDFSAMMSRFDTLLMGRRTFEAAQAMGGGAAMPGVSSVVVSSTLRQADHPQVTIINDDVKGAVSRLRSGTGKDIWLFGGGSLFRSLLDMGLVDKVEVGVIPVLLGVGIPLLAPGPKRATLRLENTKLYQKTGTVMLEYSIQRKRPKSARHAKQGAS